VEGNGDFALAAVVFDSLNQALHQPGLLGGGKGLPSRMVAERCQRVIGSLGALSVRGDLPDLLDHQVFNFQGGKIPGRTDLAASLDPVEASIIPVALATVLSGKGRSGGPAPGLKSNQSPDLDPPASGPQVSTAVKPITISNPDQAPK
jgi:hypothetical protein